MTGLSSRNQTLGITFCGGLKRQLGDDHAEKVFFVCLSTRFDRRPCCRSNVTDASSIGRKTAAPTSPSSMMHLLASHIYKADVYDNSENKISDVTDLVINSSGNITTAVIGVGGSVRRTSPSPSRI
jgi:hypothetical protein